MEIKIRNICKMVLFVIGFPVNFGPGIQKRPYPDKETVSLHSS